MITVHYRCTDADIELLICQNLVAGLRKSRIRLNPYRDVCLLFQANANFALLDLDFFHPVSKRLPKTLLRTKLLYQVDIFHAA